MLNKYSQAFLIVIVFSLLSLIEAMAQQPTPQQIEQFKRLPKAQQKALAKQLGIDLSVLRSSQRMTSDEDKQEMLQTVFPRGTQFDEYGNPVIEMEKQEDEKEEDEGLKLFGVDLFANGPASFTQLNDIPIPANYIVGAGDVIQLVMFGKENETYELQVDRNGNVIVPKLGEFNVATKSFSEVKAYLANQIKEKVIGVEVSVSLGELRSMRVFVMGEAYKPGSYNVSSLATITQAIFAAGGVTDIASLRRIQLKRAGKLVDTLDLYDLMLKGDASKDLRLQPGDVVLIPTLEKSFSVDGLVRRPAIYELKNEQSLSQAIKLAGGLLPEAYADEIGIKRYSQGQQIQLTANIRAGDMRVQSGDQLTAYPVSPVVQESITLIGAVARPGNYQWKPSLTLFDLVGSRHKQLLPEADLSYVLVLRQERQDLMVTPLQYDLRKLYAQGRNAFPKLKTNDKVLVFSKFESQRMDDIKLNELAFTQQELDEKQEELWQERIQDKLFWQQVGLIEGGQQLTEEQRTMIQERALVNLSREEQQKILEYRDTRYFSRKRMLSPVKELLRSQAEFGQPIMLVEVDGEVRVPGEYPLTQNADAGSLIIAAGGLTESAYPLNSEITRTSMENGDVSISHIAFSPKEAVKNVNSVKLMSKDRINIFSTPLWQEQLKVEVKGEVKFPGLYTVKRGEKIGDLVSRVGGITSNGEADAAIFTRKSLKIKEQQNLRDLAEELRKQIATEGLRKNSAAGSLVSYDEAKKLLNDLTRVEPVGRLVIDLAAILSGNASNDVLLEDNDVLYIPSKSQSVNVIGEVYVPTSHLYNEGYDFEDYVNKSGGYKELSDSDKTYIIRANGEVVVPNQSTSFWFASDAQAVVVRPGDTIVVPLDSDRIDNLTLWSSATQIIYQLAVAIAAIGRL